MSHRHTSQNRGRISGVHRSPEDPRDFIAESVMRTREVLPETLDLRKNLKPVRQQGNRGTCAAFAASCMKEYQEYKDVQLNEYFSPEFIYFQRENKPMDGMYLRDLMKILVEEGACLEYECVYDLDDPIKEIDDMAYESASRFTIQSYAKVNTIQGLKQSLYEKGPCVIAFPTYHSDPQFWKPEYDDQIATGGHAVAVVGWTKDGFIIRNSWGEDWGDRGHDIYNFSDFGAHWEIWTTLDDITNPERIERGWRKIVKKVILLAKQLFTRLTV